MNKILSAVLLAFLAANLAHAQAPAAPATPGAATSCEARAMDKNGKPLAGAAKASFIKKCESEGAAMSNCEAKAVDKNGKPLAGAAKSSFIKKCEADAAK